MERREAPGLPRKRPARHGTPPPAKPWVPEARRVRPADRKAGLREPIARLPGRLPALHPSPMERGGKQGDGRTWASEKTKPRDSGALAMKTMASCAPGNRSIAQPAMQSSVRVLGPEQRDRGPHQDVEVEQHRPVLDVVEVVLDAVLHLLGAGELAAPAVDLRPAGDAGLDSVAGEIAVDRLVELAVLDGLVDGVRPRTDQRQVALEHHVDELRQLVDRGLADEEADAGDARIVLGDALLRPMIGHVGVERARTSG